MNILTLLHGQSVISYEKLKNAMLTKNILVRNYTKTKTSIYIYIYTYHSSALYKTFRAGYILNFVCADFESAAENTKSFNQTGKHYQQQ